jgi:hypothetical protein
MLYGTTKEFLAIFGLANLNDLPDVQGLAREASWKPSKPEQPEQVAEEAVGPTEETADQATE